VNPVQIALDFLWSKPEIGVVLSGMTYMEHVVENIGYANDSCIGKLTDSDLEALKRAKAIRDGSLLVPCTGCKYCMPCPAGLHIPEIFRIYNKTAPALKLDPSAEYAALSVKADECLGCGKCELICPQHLHIPATMKKIVTEFSPEEKATK